MTPQNTPTTSANASAFSAALPTPCSHWLEVRDGETVDRLRPLLADRVLIGSGSQCHVQIASHEVAMVHAVLRRLEDSPLAGWSIEAMASHPAVLINGTPIREQELVSGDLIGLAGVNLVFLARQNDDGSREETTTDMDSAATDEEGDDLTAILDLDEYADTLRPAASLEALSAGDLIEAIEQDLQLIEELSEGLDERTETIPMPTGVSTNAIPPMIDDLGDDPSRVRGLASLLRAARQTQTAENETATIPMTALRRSVIVPADTDRRVA